MVTRLLRRALLGGGGLLLCLPAGAQSDRAPGGTPAILQAIGSLEGRSDPKCHATASRLEDLIYGTPLAPDARFSKNALLKELVLATWRAAAKQAPANTPEIGAAAMHSATAQWLSAAKNENDSWSVVVRDQPPRSRSPAATSSTTAASRIPCARSSPSSTTASSDSPIPVRPCRRTPSRSSRTTSTSRFSHCFNAPTTRRAPPMSRRFPRYASKAPGKHCSARFPAPPRPARPPRARDPAPPRHHQAEDRLLRCLQPGQRKGLPPQPASLLRPPELAPRSGHRQTVSAAIHRVSRRLRRRPPRLLRPPGRGARRNHRARTRRRRRRRPVPPPSRQ